MKRIGFRNLLLVPMACLMISIQAVADEAFLAIGFKYKAWSRPNTVMVTGCQNPSAIAMGEELRVPASVEHNGKTYEVKSIGSNAFAGLTGIHSVVIGEGIEVINENAFDCCVNLRSVYIPASVETVGGRLFGSCYNLTEIIVDPRNENVDSRDGSNAIIDSDENKLLAACPATKIPSTVTSIGEYAFFHCSGIEELVIPEGVESIGNCAFSGCCDLRRISLPQSLREIGFDVFGGCFSLQSLFIPKNVTSIGVGNFFYGCSDLTSVVVDEANPVFDSRSHCNAIVRTSDSSIIAACPATIIADGIGRLEAGSFSGLNIRHVHLPKSVVEIFPEAFSLCNGIETVTVDDANPSYTSPDGSNAILTKDGKTLVLGCRTTVFPDGVEAIGDYAFAGRWSKGMLRLPEGLQTIGFDAFCHCYSIYELIIPRSVTEIYPYAFSRCGNLRTLQIYGSLDKIDRCTFSDCYNLSFVSLPEGVETISGRAFANCRSLENLSLPSTVTEIEDEAFLNCPFASCKKAFFFNNKWTFKNGQGNF